MFSTPFARSALYAVAVTAVVAQVIAADRWRRTWGVVPMEADLTLTGDDLVTDPAAIDTRGITIDAPPDKVWPWLVQMGFGRAGWYSYDRIDMDRGSATRIVPEWQSLAVGEIVPTDPGGGFAVRALEPGTSLVLFADSELMTRRQRPPEETLDPVAAPGLAASGRFMGSAMPPEFAVSWAFVLRPLLGGRTRLIERVRAGFGEPTASSRVLAPALGFGVFVMMRKQMLGIRERAERLAREAPGETRIVTVPTNGPTPSIVSGVAPAG